jgi:serine/threonine protein kinase, bacterial
VDITDLPALPATRSPLSARAFGPHLLIGELIGRGGMSRVYRGWIRGSGHEVAVKVLRDDLAAKPDAVQRFVRERELLSTVASPHVVQVHDLVVHGDELGIVMDLVPGGHLRRAVAFPSELGTAAQLAAQIADGLGAVHAAGVVHRDLKPENVLVETEADGAIRLRLTDFGISRLVDSAALTATSVTGTPGYLAPEVASGRRVTAAADVYALGVMLYELCTGRQPFQAENPLLLVLAHTRQQPPRPLGMPDALWDVLARTLAKDPAARPAAAGLGDTLRALAPTLAGLPPCTVPAQAPVDAEPGPSEAPVAAASVLPRPTAPAATHSIPGPATHSIPGPSTSSIPGAGGGPGSRSAARQGRHSPDPRRPRDTRPLPVPALVTGAVAIVLAVAVGGFAVSGMFGSDQNPVVQLGTGRVPAATGPSPSGTPASSPATAAPSPHLRFGPVQHPLQAKGSPTPGTAGSPSHSPSVGSPSASLAPAVPTVTRLVATAQDRYSSDGHATLAIAGVTARAGGIASIKIRYTGQGQPAAVQSVTPSTDPQATSYTATVDGLTNGTAYTFTVEVCGTGGKCSTSQPLVFTPYGAPQVVAPQLAVNGTSVTVSVLPVVTNANPGTTSCSVTVTGTPADPGAPQQQSVSPDGDRVTFTAKPMTRYTATESCTTSGTDDTPATSTEIITPLS